MRAQLTDRQTEILAYLRRSFLQLGYGPTVREIGHKFGIRSTNGVSNHLKALQRHGYIRIRRGVDRGIELLGGPGVDMQPHIDTILSLWSHGNLATTSTSHRGELNTACHALRQFMHD